MRNEAFNDWLFHYNPYESTWNAFTREHSNDYFNGVEIPQGKYLQSADMKIILHYINWSLSGGIKDESNG